MTYFLTSSFLNNFFFNSENLNKFKVSISRDFDRFLNIQFNEDLVVNLISIILAILLTTFISSSYWYNNPQLYKETFSEQYFRIFLYSSLFVIFYLFFGRIYNVSRFYLIIFLLVLATSFYVIENKWNIFKCNSQ